jgi:hypothetical protein
VQANRGRGGFEYFENFYYVRILRGFASGQVDFLLGEGIEYIDLTDFFGHDAGLVWSHVPVGFRDISQRFVDMTVNALISVIAVATGFDKNTKHWMMA